MKKVLLLFALISYSAFYAQCTEPVITNFECGTPSYTATGALTTVANPFSNGINKSANVGRYVDDGTQGFDNLNFDKGSAINLGTNNILKFKVYSTKLVPLTVKSEGGSSAAKEINLTIDVANNWVEYTIDFSSESAENHNRIVFFFNFNRTDGTASDIYYIDDIRWEAASTSSDPVITDFESTKPSHGAFFGTPLGASNTLKLSTVSNHVSSGINTSATIGKYKDDGTAAFDGLSFNYGTAISLSTNNILKIKIYSTITAPMIAKLQSGTSPATEISVNIDVAGAWKEYTFDFSGQSAANHNELLFFFDTTGGSANPTIYYLDDIKWVSKSTWTGAINTDWTNAGNWTGGVPTATSSVEIPDVAIDPVITATTAAVANDVTLNGAATLTVNAGGSLIVNSTITGNITYKRTLTADASATKTWHLVASPVTGQTVQNFIASNTLATGVTNTSFRGIANYKNDGSAWNYYLSTYSGADNFNNATGYSVKKATAGDVNFIGTYTSGNVEANISQNINKFNLVGNPFSAYINLGQFFTDNNLTNRLDEQTIWLWNPAANSGNGAYEQKMSGTDAAFEIAPGQAFFVSAGTAGSNKVVFNGANQSHKTDTFLRSAKSEIQLTASQDNAEFKTKIYYIDGTSTGFDNGFDGSIFGGKNYDFALYTELISNNEGRKIGTQSLPKSNLENMVVPVGLNSDAGKKITFSANVANLPSDIKVFLEDRNANTFTRLDEANSKYTVTLTAAANGIGQFYLHTSKSALSIKEVNINNVSVYTIDKSTLKVVGLAQGKTNVKLFNILGKQVLNTSFKTNGVQEIPLPKLATGMYIVQVENEAGKLNKKIILE